MRSGEYNLDPRLRVGLFVRSGGTGRRRAVYTGMRKALLITMILAALPAVAHAKTGVIYQKDPETVKVGDRIHFTVVTMQEPGSPTGTAKPVVGIHPLVPFRSGSGHVIRVRASRTDASGMGRGSVVFTDKGPW